MAMDFTNQDPDDDGDGIPTQSECPLGVPCPDSDGNGIVDYLDSGAGNGQNWIWLPIINDFSN